MDQITEEALWATVDRLAKNTNCKKREVGCVIYNVKLNTVVGRGNNKHLDTTCDCHSTRTAIHAEDVALQSMVKVYPREDLVLFVNHAPCPNCKSLIETRVKEVRYRSQD